MKSYTDLNQSRKLAEILPLESADFHFSANQSPQGYLEKPIWGNPEYADYNAFPCWSLVALLEWLKLNVKGFINLQLLGGLYFASWYSPSYAMAEPKFDEKVSEIETYEHNTPISAVIDLIEQLKKAMEE